VTPTVAAFSLTGLTGTAAEPTYNGDCPHSFNFTANLEVLNSGTVTYHWERSDGTVGPNLNLSFTGTGSQSQNIDYSWPLLGSPGQNSADFVKIFITSPTNTSSTINFTQKCSLTGAWIIKFGPGDTGTMNLVQVDNNITGNYNHDSNPANSGTISSATAANSDNRVIHGTWNINLNSGNFTWHFVGNTNTFHGSYNNGGFPWCGTYTGGTLPVDGVCLQAP
jgi:hypothetical protein